MTEFLRGATLLLALLLAGCGGPTPGHAPDSAAQAQQQASTRSGDIVVRANAIPTSTLGAVVATQYGIARDPKTVMLLVAVRRGAEPQETAATLSKCAAMARTKR